MAAQISPIQVPQTGGAMISFGHLTLTLNDNQEMTGGFENLKFKISDDSENVYSNNPDPVGFTLGDNKYEASVQLYYAWAMNLIQSIGPGWQKIPWTAYFKAAENAAASPIGAGLVYTAATLIACRLTSIEMSGQAGQGGKALTVPIDLKPLKIYPAGVGGAQGVDGNPFPLVSPGQG
jgi:hypothetical protein